MRVRRDKCVASHIGPEPCAGNRDEGVGEASVGVRAGQPLSHDRIAIPGADAVQEAEGNTYGRVIARVQTTRRGRRTRHALALIKLDPPMLTGSDPLSTVMARYRAQ